MEITFEKSINTNYTIAEQDRGFYLTLVQIFGIKPSDKPDYFYWTSRDYSKTSKYFSTKREAMKFLSECSNLEELFI